MLTLITPFLPFLFYNLITCHTNQNLLSQHFRGISLKDEHLGEDAYQEKLVSQDSLLKTAA